MKKNKLLFILAFVIISVCSKGQAQSSLKSITEVFEYASALYYPDMDVIVIDCKNLKGELVQFRYSKQDALKTEEILFNKPLVVTKDPILIVTKTELVGKKFNLTYNSAAALDPSNPACCYKITAVTPL